jgi:hypothetical protein
MISTKNILRSASLLFLAVPSAAFASVQITEVMYDLEGADGGFEWIEITNTGTAPVDVGAWRLFEANTNHKLTLSKGQSTMLLPGASAIIADKPENFLSHWSDVSLVFDSAFSLSNTGESLALKNGTEIVDRVAYTEEMGAKGDGGSLHRRNDSFVAGMPNPGEFPGTILPVKQKQKESIPTSKSKSSRVDKSALTKTEPVSNVSAAVIQNASASSAPLLPWILGLMSIVGLGIATVSLARAEAHKPETSDPSDGFEIIDTF